MCSCLGVTVRFPVADVAKRIRDVGKEVRFGENVMPDPSAVFMASQLADFFTTVSEKAIRKENKTRTQIAIEKLSDSDRDIIALRLVELMSNCEIAIVLEIGTSAATSRYVRAIRRPRDELGEWYRDLRK